MEEHKSVRILNPEVSRKIAAGEVIDRPNAIVRELMDNAVDSGADNIRVEITGGGIERIRVIDNGGGMTKEDLETCAHPHATSKIVSEKDLLSLSTLGFRGEALASMAAVSRLQIQSGGWKMNVSVTEDHILTQTAATQGTIVQTEALFENFPARRVFLKRPASEGSLCRSTFEEKVLPRPDIAFSLYMDGEEKLTLPKGQSLVERFTQALSLFEDEKLFYEVKGAADDGSWSFTMVIGEPSVTRPNRKNLYIYVNGRRIQEYSLTQAIEYGCQGYFPNGQHPVACLFVTMDSSQVDFNIHPAKREARFKDISGLHHGVSSATKEFFKNYTVAKILPQTEQPVTEEPDLGFERETGVEDKQQTTVRFPKAEKSDLRSFGHSQKIPSFNYRPVGASSYSGLSSLVASAIEDDVSEPESFKPNYIHEKYDSSEDSFHFVGSALGTFLIAEKDDTLYIIDQHAAHERILYNNIMEKAGEKQPLLVPYRIVPQSEGDDAYISALSENFSEWGFECEKSEDGSWLFTSVPVRWKGTEQDLQHDILDRRINPKDIINAVAASTACRRAVMDGTVLDRETASDIARKALLLPDPHCPHGRPVFTKITRSQLFSLVKRT